MGLRQQLNFLIHEPECLHEWALGLQGNGTGFIRAKSILDRSDDRTVMNA